MNKKACISEINLCRKASSRKTRWFSRGRTTIPIRIPVVSVFQLKNIFNATPSAWMMELINQTNKAYQLLNVRVESNWLRVLERIWSQIHAQQPKTWIFLCQFAKKLMDWAFLWWFLQQRHRKNPPNSVFLYWFLSFCGVFLLKNFTKKLW